MGQLDRRLLLGAIVAGVGEMVAARPVSARAMTLAEVVGRHIEARGGAAAIDRIHSCKIDVEIVEGGQTIQGRYYADLKPLARIDIVVGGTRVYSEGFDRHGVWLWPGDAPAATPSVAQGSANALLHGVMTNLSGLHAFEALGHRLSLLPGETIDGVAYHVILCRYSTGHTTYVFIDPETWMIVRRRDERAYHPDVDQTRKRVETRYSDFRKEGGVVVSNRSDDYDLDAGALLSTAVVKARVWNPDLPQGLFERTYVPA